VLGIGGVFFKSPDPAKLHTWYERCLGLKSEPGAGVMFRPEAMPEHSVTVWNAFEASSDYFDPSRKEFMFNLIVDNLREALEQVREAGGQIVGEVEEYDFGKFGHFLDPDGNKVELWEPVAHQA
jgi:predicted enzyme related to lactoylglutathione lyase